MTETTIIQSTEPENSEAENQATEVVQENAVQKAAELLQDAREKGRVEAAGEIEARAETADEAYDLGREEGAEENARDNAMRELTNRVRGIEDAVGQMSLDLLAMQNARENDESIMDITADQVQDVEVALKNEGIEIPNENLVEESEPEPIKRKSLLHMFP